MRFSIQVHSGICQYEIVSLHGTSPVDQVCSWLMQHPAGSRDSCRIAAAERSTYSNRNQLSIHLPAEPRWRRLLCRRRRHGWRRWRRKLGRGWRRWRIRRRGDQQRDWPPCFTHWICFWMQCQSAHYLEYDRVIDVCCNGSVVVEDALWWCWRRNADRINVVPGVLGSKDQQLLKHEHVKWKQFTGV